MSTITWLHLSDLHFRAGDQHTWDTDIVLSGLLEDCESVLSRINCRLT